MESPWAESVRRHAARSRTVLHARSGGPPRHRRTARDDDLAVPTLSDSQVLPRGIEACQAKPFLLALLGPAIYRDIAGAFYQTRFSCSIAIQSLVLRRALQRIESPVVVAFGTSVNVITLKACKGLGRRVVISERNNPHRLIASWERVWRKYYKQADTVTANTRAALRDMRDFVGVSKMAFVPNPPQASERHRRR